MGVYIKGMKMPKTCFECDLYNDKSNFCEALKEYMPFASFGRDYKKTNCPLVEVREPHGRLIDADELFDKMRCSNWCVSFFLDGTFLDISEFADIIRNIVEIIEAESE